MDQAAILRLEDRGYHELKQPLMMRAPLRPCGERPQPPPCAPPHAGSRELPGPHPGMVPHNVQPAQLLPAVRLVAPAPPAPHPPAPHPPAPQPAPCHRPASAGGKAVKAAQSASADKTRKEKTKIDPLYAAEVRLRKKATDTTRRGG